MNPPDPFWPVRHCHAGGRSVAVRELAWPDALELFSRLARLAPAPGADADPGGAAGELVSFLLTRATDVPPAEIPRLPAGAAFQLAAAALELTLNDEVLKAGKSAAERLGRTFGLTWAPSSNSSSPPVMSTPGATPSGS